MKLFRVQDVMQVLYEALQDKAIAQSHYDSLYNRLNTLELIDEYNGMKASASWILGSSDSVFCDSCGYCLPTIEKASTYCPNCGRPMMFDKLF